MQKMSLNYNSKNNNYMPIMIGLGVIVGVLLLVLIVLLINSGTSDDEYQPYVDPVSGETIWEIDEEPEAGGELVMVGFNQLSNFGFMSVQYNKIIDTVKEYTTANYPRAMRASYRSGSFKYLDKDLFVSTFEYVLNDEKTITVKLDTGGSLKEIDVKISGS